MTSKPSVAELFRQYPPDPDDIPWYMRDEVDRAVEATADIHTQTDPIEHLEELRERDYQLATLARRALFMLPPEVVTEQLGTDIALWAALTETVMGEADELKANLESRYGYHLGRLESARLWLWQRGGYMNSVKQILADYRLMEVVHGDALHNIDLPEILQNSARSDTPLSDKRIADYSLVPANIEHDRFSVEGYIDGWNRYNDKTTSYDSWLDTPSGFALTYRDKPQALVGVVMRGQDEVMIHQLQGVRAKRVDRTKPYSEEVVGRVSARGLMPLDWQRVMVTTTERIARRLGLSAVGIRSGENNVWTKLRLPSEKEPHMTLEQAGHAYDTPAARLGYTRAEDIPRDWHKQLES
ncbi:MAG: hypothetical protein WBP12_02155 [Candidatus Saccharimonas sp.]